MKSQFNGLLIKNFNLLTKQTGTMICQIITPIICLAFVYLIQLIVEANIGKTAYGVKFDYPLLFNVPFYQKTAYSSLPIKVQNCDEWYLYDFDKDISQEDIDFFGYNNGNEAVDVKLRSDNVNNEQESTSFVKSEFSKKANLWDSEDEGDIWNSNHKSYIKSKENNNNNDNNKEIDSEEELYFTNDKEFIDFYTNKNIKNISYNNSNYKSYSDTTPYNFFSKVPSAGMLTSELNILQSRCSKNSGNKMAPYFIRAEKDKSIEIDINYKTTSESIKVEPEKYELFDNSINQELYTRLQTLNKISFSLIRNEYGIEILPDGAITVKKSNKNNFSYNLQVNDNKFPYYHKNNGVTMFKIYNGQRNSYSKFMNVMNGALWVTDLFNRAYMKMFHPELYLISGIQPMPFEIDNSENIQRIINLAGSTFYPLAISLLMPLFMYTIVLEKESKLVEIMKINGMKMTYYWLSLFTFNFIVYFTTFFIFYIVGRFIFAFKLFTDTDSLLLFIIFFGWGLCQIGLAFFFQAFLSNARTSTSKISY